MCRQLSDSGAETYAGRVGAALCRVTISICRAGQTDRRTDRRRTDALKYKVHRQSGSQCNTTGTHTPRGITHRTCSSDDRGQTNTHTQTDRQTDTLITILRCPIGSGVTRQSYIYNTTRFK